MSSDRPADEVVAEARATKRIKEDISEVVETSGNLFSKTQFQQQMVRNNSCAINLISSCLF